MATITIGDDWGEYHEQPYWASNNVWNKGEHQNGEDFSQTIRIDTKAFPEKTVVSWDWPDEPDWTVYAYPELLFGYKPWSHAGSLDFTSRIDALRTFEVDYDFSISGQTDHFNVAFSLWLTDEPGGEPRNITTEVMVWVHEGRFPPAGDVVARHETKTFQGDVFHRPDHFDLSGESDAVWQYVALQSDADMLKGTIDFAEILRALKDKGVISGSEYVSGYEIGAEVSGGSGTLRINELDESFSRYRITDRADTLRGTMGRDEIDGKGGKDKIFGAAGPDILAGGRGADQLTGGKGGDTFIFRKTSDSTVAKQGRDTILDFSPRQKDKIDVSAIDADDSVGGDQSFAFIGKAAFSGTPGELRFGTDGKHTYIYGDVDGDARADFAIMLKGAIDLKAADFVL